MWISGVLYQADVRVGHEHIHRDGMASWYAAAAEKDPRDIWWFRKYHTKGGANDCKLRDFKHAPIIFHQIRHPLKAISTFQRATQQSWVLIQHVLMKCGIELRLDWPVAYRCMVYWLRWNELAARIASWRYRIEALYDVWPEFCERVQRPHLLEHRAALLDPDRRAHRSNSQTESYIPLRWRHLRQLDKTLADAIAERGCEYGYRM